MTPPWSRRRATQPASVGVWPACAARSVPASWVRAPRHGDATRRRAFSRAVDVTDTSDVAVEALAAHRVYILGLGWSGSDARSWLDTITTDAGKRLGVRHAVAFETI